MTERHTSLEKQIPPEAKSPELLKRLRDLFEASSLGEPASPEQFRELYGAVEEACRMHNAPSGDAYSTDILRSSGLEESGSRLVLKLDPAGQSDALHQYQKKELSDVGHPTVHVNLLSEGRLQAKGSWTLGLHFFYLEDEGIVKVTADGGFTSRGRNHPLRDQFPIPTTSFRRVSSEFMDTVINMIGDPEELRAALTEKEENARRRLARSGFAL